jgi:hypothetical protein
MLDYDREFETMDVICDCCSDSETFEGSWSSCRQQALETGWQFWKQEDGWIERCAGCVLINA